MKCSSTNDKKSDIMVAHDLPQSSVSAKTWEGLNTILRRWMPTTDTIYQGIWTISSLAGNYSLKAIRSEKGYKNPYDLLSSLASAYAIIGRQNDAIEYCNKTIELDPTSVYGWSNKGFALENQGRYDEALKAYDEAIRLIQVCSCMEQQRICSRKPGQVG